MIEDSIIKEDSMAVGAPAGNPYQMLLQVLCEGAGPNRVFDFFRSLKDLPPTQTFNALEAFIQHLKENRASTQTIVSFLQTAQQYLRGIADLPLSTSPSYVFYNSTESMHHAVRQILPSLAGRLGPEHAGELRTTQDILRQAEDRLVQLGRMEEEFKFQIADKGFSLKNCLSQAARLGSNFVQTARNFLGNAAQAARNQKEAIATAAAGAATAATGVATAEVGALLAGAGAGGIATVAGATAAAAGVGVGIGCGINELIGQPCLGDWSGLTASDAEWEANAVDKVHEDFNECEETPDGGTLCWSGEDEDMRAKIRKINSLD